MQGTLLKLFTAAGLLLAGTAVHAEDLLTTYRQALESDPQLRAAEAGYRAAREARPQSRSALLPQISLNADYTHHETDIQDSAVGGSTGSSDYDSNGYSLSLRQSLYHHDYYVQLRQADAVIAQAEAQFAGVRQSVILRVAEAYFNLLAAQDNLDFAQAEKRAIAQQLRQTQQRFEVGLNAITDVHEAQARYDASVAQEIAAENQLNSAHEVLRELTGRGYEALVPLDEEMPLLSPEPNDIDAWVKTSQEQNLQLLAAEAAVRAAREETNRRRAGHYPTFDLVASHGYSDTMDSPTFGTERTDTTIGLQMSLPLYSGGLTSSRTREAEYLYNQAQDTLERQRRASVRQTRDAYLGVIAGISQVKAFRQALSSARTALQATQAGFEVGTRTAVDVLDSQRELYRAQRDYARSRYDYVLASLRLRQAAGTLSEADVNQVNRWLQ